MYIRIYSYYYCIVDNNEVIQRGAGFVSCTQRLFYTFHSRTSYSAHCSESGRSWLRQLFRKEPCGLFKTTNILHMTSKFHEFKPILHLVLQLLQRFVCSFLTNRVYGNCLNPYADAPKILILRTFKSTVPGQQVSPSKNPICIIILWFYFLLPTLYRIHRTVTKTSNDPKKSINKLLQDDKARNINDPTESWNHYETLKGRKPGRVSGFLQHRIAKHLLA